MNFNTETNTKAVLVGITTDDITSEESEKSIAELERLLETAGGEAFAKVIQSRHSPDKNTLIGKGKLEEISALCKDNEIELVIFDTELSPSQIKNIEDALDNVDVIDRSMLILDIFALHAKSGEGKLQVELAQLKYTAPRLIGKGKEMSRLEGRIGTRGPGESKLEQDRRHLKTRGLALEDQLSELERSRAVTRRSRERSGIIRVAIVGYTNAGKSTLLNYLTNANILAEDKLFATLDPTTRRLTLPSGEEVLLTDTVGFIRKLPHHLINAFKSTLEEAKYADIILNIIDISDSEYHEQLAVTEQLLEELGAGGKPTVYAYNKCDVAENPVAVSGERANRVMISAKTGLGIDGLLNMLAELAANGKRRCFLRFKNSEQGLVARLYKEAQVENVDYKDDSVEVTAMLDAKLRGIYKDYIENGGE